MSPSVRPIVDGYAHLHGRSPDFAGRWFENCLPGCPVALRISNLAAHSCGGSHGFGPFWVVLTVFPLRPFIFRFGAPSKHDLAGLLGGCQPRIVSDYVKTDIQIRTKLTLNGILTRFLRCLALY